MAANEPKFAVPVEVVLLGVGGAGAPMKHRHFPDREETLCGRAYDAAQEALPNDGTDRECPKCLKELGAIEAEIVELREKWAKWQLRSTSTA